MNSAGKRRIFGLSDSTSFFVPDKTQPVMGRKLISLSQKINPAICYIGAARGDAQARISEFEKFAARIGATSRILSLFDPPSTNACRYFDNIDIIFVDGGSTRNLIALLREWNVVEAMIAAYKGGVMLAGASAGTNIFFEWCITDSVRSKLMPCEGLGILDGSVCVHYDGHPERAEIFDKFLKEDDSVFPAYGLDDGVAVYFENERIHEIIKLRPDADFHEFSKVDGMISKSSVPPNPKTTRQSAAR